MPKYLVTVDGKNYEVSSDRELDDAAAYQAALAQHAPTGRIPSTATPVSDDEPGTWWGGFWKGLKDYAKSLPEDPATMATVGAGLAAAAVPATGGASALLIPALGAMGGAGASHAVKQLRSGVREEPIDVAASMGKEGAIAGALSAVPMGAAKVGPKLLARAERLAGQSALERHAPAALAQAVLHNPVITGAVEAAQMPFVNRGAGRALTAIGEIPETAGRMMRRAVGADVEAGRPVVDRFMPNKSGFRPGAPAAEPADVFPDPFDRYMPNSSAGPDRYFAREADIIPNPVDRYMPNTSGYRPNSFAPAADVAAPVEDPFGRVTRGHEMFFGNDSRPLVAPERGAGAAAAVADDGPRVPYQQALADVDDAAAAPVDDAWESLDSMLDEAVSRDRQLAAPARARAFRSNGGFVEPEPTEFRLPAKPAARPRSSLDVLEQQAEAPTSVGGNEQHPSTVRSLMHPQTAFGPAPSEFSDAALEGAIADYPTSYPFGLPKISSTPAAEAMLAAPAPADIPADELLSRARWTGNAPTPEGDVFSRIDALRAAKSVEGDVTSALKNLGYGAAEARAAARAGSQGAASFEDAMKTALRHLPRR